MRNIKHGHANNCFLNVSQIYSYKQITKQKLQLEKESFFGVHTDIPYWYIKTDIPIVLSATCFNTGPSMLKINSTSHSPYITVREMSPVGQKHFETAPQTIQRFSVAGTSWQWNGALNLSGVHYFITIVGYLRLFGVVLSS